MRAKPLRARGRDVEDGDDSSDSSSDASEEEFVAQTNSWTMLGGLKRAKTVPLASISSCWTKCLAPTSSTAFAVDLEWSVRAACFMVLYIFVYMSMRGLHWLDRWDGKLGLAQNGALYFMFTLWKSFGASLDLFRQNLIGISLWAVHEYIWVGLILGRMLHLHVTEDGLTWTSALIWGEGVVYIFVSLWLNWHPNVCLWLVNSFVWSWMDNLTPNNKGKIKIFVESNIMGVVIGGLLALLCCLLPYPIFAIWKARDAANKTITLLGDSWEELVRCVVHEEGSVHLRLMTRDIKKARGRVADLSSSLDEARFEVWFCCRWRTSYRVLSRAVPFLQTACDQLLDTINVVLEGGLAIPNVDKSISMEGYNQELVDVLREPMQDAAHTIADLHSVCCRIIKDGQFNDDTQMALHAAERRMDDACSALAEKRAVVKERLKNQSPSTVGEHEVNLCILSNELRSFAYSSATFVKEMEADVEDTRRPLCHLQSTIADIFDRSVLFSARHIRWALRFTVQLTIAQIMGFFGFGNTGMGRYSVYISNALSVLVNQRGPGSEVLKDFSRIQGMIMGTVGGQFVNYFFNHCDPVDYIISYIILLVWMICSFYLIFHSTEYTTMYFGYMVAEFGIFGMVVPCDTQTLNPKNMFFRVSCLIISLLVLLIVSFFIPQETASTVAGENLCQAYRELTDWVNNFPRDLGSKADVSALVDKSATFAKEANNEPRNWKLPWQDALFQKAVSGARVLNDTVLHLEKAAMLEAVARKGSGEERSNAPSASFLRIVELPAFKRYWEVQGQQLALLSQMVSHVFEEGYATPSSEMLQANIDCAKGALAWENARSELSADALQIMKSGTDHPHSVEWQQTRMLLACYRTLQHEVQRIQEAFMYDS